MERETIVNQVDELISSGININDIFVNDGDSEWGESCAFTRTTAESMLDDWGLEGPDRDEMMSKLTPAIDY